MIHINLLLPFRGDILNIPCEEELISDKLMEQIHKMLPDHREKWSWLCHVEARHQLLHNQTLKDNGIMDGSSLIMI